MRAWHPTFHRIALDAFGAGLGTLAVLLVLEAGLRGFVSRFFNLDWLVLWILAASLLAFATRGPASDEKKEKPEHFATAIVIALAAAAFVRLGLPPGLSRGWQIAAVGGALAVFLLAALLLKDE